MSQMHWTEDEFDHAITEISRRSMVDYDFRQLALRDSAAAFAKFNPKPLPGYLEIRFLDNSGDTRNVVLPPAL